MNKKQLAGVFCAGAFSLGLVSTANAAIVYVSAGLDNLGAEVDVYYIADDVTTGIPDVTGIYFDFQPSVSGIDPSLLLDNDVATVASNSGDTYDQFTDSMSLQSVSVSGGFLDITSIQFTYLIPGLGGSYPGECISGDCTFFGGYFGPAGLASIVTLSGLPAQLLSSPSAVPVPAAAWLFGSGLIGLAGIARRKKA